MAASLLEVIDVHFSHEVAEPLFRGLGFRVGEGERVGIIAAGGAGKSTLARLLTGHLRPSAGHIDRTVDVAYQVALDRFDGDTPVRGVLGDAAARERDTGAVHRALESVGLGASLASRPLRTLSAGERQRVALAGGLAMPAPLLVLDSPTAGLDPAAGERVVRAIHERRGALVVLTSDLHLAVDVCRRALVLSDGRIVAEGPPAELLTDGELLAEHGLPLPAAISPSWLRRRARLRADAHPSRSRLHMTLVNREVETADVPVEIAHRIGASFDAFHTRFQGITRRASRRFAQREWAAQEADASERLQLHRQIVEDCVAAVQPLLTDLDEQARRRAWVAARHTYGQAIAWRPDSELAETFFNSVTRRVFAMVGIDDDLEFRWFGGIILPVVDPGQGEVATYRRRAATTELVRAVLEGRDLRTRWADIDGDAALAARRIDEHLEESREATMPVEVDMLRPVFFRNKGAYLVGRIRHLNRVTPLVFALDHSPGGLRIDAVLMTENLVSRIFGFTRSYFHVDAREPAAVVAFLKSLLPLKPVAEIYTAIGHNAHGKTQLFRGLYRHLESSTDRFELARGVKGLVMTVFTLPSFDVVFKVIKDTFPPSKRTSRDQVMEKYRLVFAHDRVGRMVDAQSFENLRFPRDRFDDELLEELALSASRTVEITEDSVVITHLYTERRLYPLDLFLQEMPEAAARAAALDYGRAVKDLAAANIFPGDLFTKNFGVTRHGSVVFYDYDELTLLESCNFREMPEAPDYADELAAEPWFPVGPDDIFPEEFAKFFRLPPGARDDFHRHHGDLCEVHFWRSMQACHAAGEVPDFFPYPAEARLSP